MIALELFKAHGYAGTSMADVARKVGTTKGALYHHFETKEELFISALAIDTSHPLEAIEHLAAQTADPALRWREALGHAHDAVFKRAMGHMLPVLAQTGNQVPAVACDYHQQVIERFRKGLRSIYADAARTDAYRTLNAEDVDQIVFGPLLANALTQSLMANTGDLNSANLARTDRASFIAMIERLTRCD